jgi:hypothetical protein
MAGGLKRAGRALLKSAGHVQDSSMGDGSWVLNPEFQGEEQEPQIWTINAGMREAGFLTASSMRKQSKFCPIFK